MSCCGKARKQFQNQVVQAKSAPVVPKSTKAPVVPSPPPLSRADRIKFRQERIKRRSERIALRQARIAARSTAKENSKNP